MKSRGGAAGKRNIVLEQISGGINLIGVPVFKDAATYIQSDRISPRSIVRNSSGTEMVVERQNGFVLSGYERNNRSNDMRIDLRFEKAVLEYRAEIEEQGKLL